MNKLRSLLSALLLVGATAGVQLPAQAAQNDAVAEVRKVVEAFRTAIIDKDKTRFMSLFVPGAVTWKSVWSDESLALVRKKHPQAAKMEVDPKNNPKSFIDNIVAEKNRSEEKFSDIKIETDGDIATVIFDYSFNINDRKTNYGKEAWHLLRTEQGWRIVSVIWSMTLPKDA